MKHLIQICIAAFKKNLVPGIFLQLFAILLVGSYYQVPGVAESLESVVEIKLYGPYLFSAVTTMFFGGLMPLIIMHMMGRQKYDHRLLVFTIVLWSWKGAEIEAFYELQGIIWGVGNAAHIISKKVLFDQLVFSAFWAVPFTSLALLFRNVNYNVSRFKESINKTYFKEVIMPMLLGNWILWFPACTFVYMMPGPLQTPLFSIILCFYVLMAEFITSGKEREQMELNESKVNQAN
ncbi:MAG: hypothetical protein MK193_03695 [Lentisphaeria bacterium]|nr:hypothetical protein [Lentisphaeria bacterium]